MTKISEIMEGAVEMSAEKYVNDIVRKIKCTGKRKREIRDQLLSDIAVRREQGEPLERIMESMGSAKEIAEAFCQNLSEADKKAYRRRRIGSVVGAVAAVLVFAVACIWWFLPKPAALGDEFSEAEITAEVEKVIGFLDQNEFDKLQEIAVDQIRPALTQQTIGPVRQGISDDWGSRQSLGRVYAQGAKQSGKFIIVTQVDAIYENVSVVYTISFDKDLRLAGLYMR